MAQRIVIRKYENRRLYDTANSRYVNVEDVARLVREGHELEVVDAKTGEDVTRLVLAQVILEEARGADSGVPLDFLRDLVRASDRATRDFLQRSLGAALERSRRVQEAWSGGSGFPFWPWGDKGTGDRGTEQQPPGAVAQEAPAPAAPAEPPAPESDIERLKRRLEELEARVDRQRNASRRPARKRARKPDAGDPRNR